MRHVAKTDLPVGRRRGIVPTMTLTAIIYPDSESDWLVAHNPETGTTTQGKTIEEALAHLKEATELYLEEFPMSETKRAILTTFDVQSAHA